MTSRTKINFSGALHDPEVVTYKIGSVFWSDGSLSMLAQVSGGKVACINITGSDVGNRWTEAMTANPAAVTSKQVAQILGTDLYRYIPEITITCK
jgi:hypothetical protein